LYHIPNAIGIISKAGRYGGTYAYKDLAFEFGTWINPMFKLLLIKGFTMNDDLLKRGGGYFEELLERIREIRSSEKVFYRKVLEIYATSVDYNPNVETTKLFFQTVQNKLHWALCQ